MHIIFLISVEEVVIVIEPITLSINMIKYAFDINKVVVQQCVK